LLLVLLGSSAAKAQTSGAEAEVLFKKARDLLTAGKIPEACAAFDESEKLEPTLSTLLNQANCREKNNQLATAWGLYLDAKRQSESATDATTVKLHGVAVEHAQRLEGHISTLLLSVPDENKIEGLEIERDDQTVDPETWNQALPIDGGTYTITVRAPGATPWTSTVTVSPEADVKTVTIPKLQPVAPVIKPEPESAPAPTPASSPTTEPHEAKVETPPVRESGRGRRIIGIAAAGAGLAAWIATAALAVDAKSTWSSGESDCHMNRCGDVGYEKNRTARGLANAATGTFIAGALLVATGATIWLTSSRGSSEKRAAIVPLPGGIGVVAAGRF
jgi:hypothetical protein